jgi:hypothetical protein
MRRVINFVVVAAFAAEALVVGQSADVNRILADVRTALGGEQKLAAVKSLTATGRATRVNGDSSTAPTDFEMAIELPDKFMKKDTVAVIMDTTITRTIGFNGNGLIDAMDAPPSMGHGMVIRSVGGGTATGSATPPTPDETAAARKAGVLAAKQEFVRLTLGMLPSSSSAYPIQFGYEGQAEAPGGKADIITVKGDGDFSARFFVDTETHLPLLLSWMAKEPLVMQGNRSGPGGAQTMVIGGGAGGGMPSAAEATRKVVEYRLYYGDYKAVDGIKVPLRLQRSIDGKPTEELLFDKIRFNPKIDPKKFETVK